MSGFFTLEILTNVLDGFGKAGYTFPIMKAFASRISRLCLPGVLSMITVGVFSVWYAEATNGSPSHG